MSTILEGVKAINKTVVFTGPGQVTLEESPMPVAGPGQMLIRTTKTLISTGTELTIFSGEFPKGSAWDGYGQYPFKAGYSNVGEVVEVGEGVDYSWLGKKVGCSAPHCAFHVKRPEGVIELPEGIPDEQAAFHALAGIVMNGVRRSRVNWGESVVIYGLGLLGQLAARFCALNGARPVIGVDVSTDRIAMLPQVRYLHGLHGAECNVPEKVKGLTKERMADIVFEVTGNQQLINKEFELLKPQGRFVLLSSPRGATMFDFHDNCNFLSYEIIGAHVCSQPKVETPYNPWTGEHNRELFFRHIADGDIDVGSLITHREPGERGPEVFGELLADRSKAMGVILDWE